MLRNFQSKEHDIRGALTEWQVFLPCNTGNMTIPSKPCMKKQKPLCWLYIRTYFLPGFKLFFDKYQKRFENPAKHVSFCR